MADFKAAVARAAEPKVIELGGGVSRRILAHNEQMMIVEVSFEKGSVGAVHTHPHAQSTYILSGAYTFTCGDASYDVQAGDTLAFPPDVPHGTLCREAGKLLDIFSPARADFLK